MHERRVRLYLNNIAEIAGNSDIAILAMTDELKTRLISIVCEMRVGLAIKMRLEKRAETANQLPEVVAKMLKAKGTDSYEMIINGIEEGQYKTVIHDNANDDYFDIRVSDGILLAMASDMPIYIEESLMNKQAVTFRPAQKGVSVPVNIITVPMLEESLQRAIEEENYEIAAKLYEELERRKKNNK